MLARLIIVGSLVMGCTVETDVPVRILVADSVGDVQFLDVFALPGGCPDSPLTLVDGGTRFSDTRAFEIPGDAAAIAAFAIRGCQRVAYNCQPLAGPADITVTLEPLESPQGLCTEEEICQDNGLCEMTVTPPRCDADLVDPDLDRDEDGRSNGEECGDRRECFSPDGCVDIDEDEDGIPDWLDPIGDPPRENDADGDGLLDLFECCDDGDCADLRVCYDTDRDGTPDYLDTDSDGDGIPDDEECRESDCVADSDRDGFIGVRDMDADGDGLVDGREADRGTGIGTICGEGDASECGSCGGCAMGVCAAGGSQCTPPGTPYELTFAGPDESLVLLVGAASRDSMPAAIPVAASIAPFDARLRATVEASNLPTSIPPELLENDFGADQCVAGCALRSSTLRSWPARCSLRVSRPIRSCWSSAISRSQATPRRACSSSFGLCPVRIHGLSIAGGINLPVGVRKS